MSDPEVDRISIEMIRAPKNEPISDSRRYFGMIQKIQSPNTYVQGREKCCMSDSAKYEQSWIFAASVQISGKLSR